MAEASSIQAKQELLTGQTRPAGGWQHDLEAPHPRPVRETGMNTDIEVQRRAGWGSGALQWGVFVKHSEGHVVQAEPGHSRQREEGRCSLEGPSAAWGGQECNVIGYGGGDGRGGERP